MDVRAREDIVAAAAVHTELGQGYDGAVAGGLVERISSEIDKQVDARLAQRGIQPSVATWTNLAIGLGSIGLGIGATAVTLQSWSASGVAPKAELDLGSFWASLLTGARSVSTTQVILIAPLWVAISVVNVAYARRHLGRP
jgi:hypothetical protein